VALPFFLKHEGDDGKLETPIAPPLVAIFLNIKCIKEAFLINLCFLIIVLFFFKDHSFYILFLLYFSCSLYENKNRLNGRANETQTGVEEEEAVNKRESFDPHNVW
jgi:hypothetical protein